MSSLQASVDVLLYPGVLPPSPFTSAISTISLSLVTKLIEVDIYIYNVLNYVNLNLHFTNARIVVILLVILENIAHAYHSIFVHQHLKKCSIIGQLFNAYIVSHQECDREFLKHNVITNILKCLQ